MTAIAEARNVVAAVPLPEIALTRGAAASTAELAP